MAVPAGSCGAADRESSVGSLLETVGPVFSIVALGWWLAGRSRMDLPTLSNLALLVTSPALRNNFV